VQRWIFFEVAACSTKFLNLKEKNILFQLLALLYYTDGIGLFYQYQPGESVFKTIFKSNLFKLPFSK
jgi:hypothetical protein